MGKCGRFVLVSACACHPQHKLKIRYSHVPANVKEMMSIDAADLLR
jgi:hypothetical protein